MISAYRIKIAPNSEDPLHRVLKHIGSAPQVLYRHPDSAKVLESQRSEEIAFNFEVTKQKPPKNANKLEDFILSDHISSKNAGAALRSGNHSPINCGNVNNNHDTTSSNLRLINKKVRQSDFSVQLMINF